jgi:hypothetical protein
MIPYKLDFAIDEMASTELAAQGLLQAYTGKVIPKTEAAKVLQRIPNHKWYLSERLGRDVGMHVAAVDFVENFYEPVVVESLTSRYFKLLREGFGGLRAYFRAKSGLMTR